MITKDTKLRFWCQKVLPLVYDDSLSYYELLNKVVWHLNKHTEEINALIDFYITFQEDVEEIIQKMIEDGLLQPIITETIGALIAEAFNTETYYLPFDYCTKDGKLYRANKRTNGEWVAADWDEKTIGEDLTTVQNRLYGLNAGQVAYDSESTYSDNTVGKALQNLDIKQFPEGNYNSVADLVGAIILNPSFTSGIVSTGGTLTQALGGYNVNGEVIYKYLSSANAINYMLITDKQRIQGRINTSTYEVTIYNISENRFIYNVNGKHLWIYHYGDNGNDWCWVRTPANYDADRAKPYPVVVCNHGNGWVMDGTEQYANYTKRTMYVPLDDPDYIAHPDQYNGTSDETLWYSNPTIEALLSAGYVVCGAENYGDLLYGNENCRNACVNFVNHIINSYNVEQRVCMIGVSNGALTTLNAAYLIPDKIKSIILQYPVCALVNQYENNSSHKGYIRTAYGISDANISLDDLTEIVATHDPLTTDVVNGIKCSNIPPIKAWYSKSDTVAQYSTQIMALYNVLKTSNKMCELVEATGAHGDYTHFDPTATVNWFNEASSSVSSFKMTGVEVTQIQSNVEGIAIYAYRYGRIICLSIQAVSAVTIPTGSWLSVATLPYEFRTAFRDAAEEYYLEIRVPVIASGNLLTLRINGGSVQMTAPSEMSVAFTASAVYVARE